MQKATKYFLVFLIGISLFQSVSCAGSNGKNADEIEAEQTLQALYAQETAQAKAAAAPAPTKVPLLMPREVPESIRTLKDTDSSIRAYENRAVSGDRFLDSLFERPFTSQEMIYQPDLDIYTVDFAYDENFYYFTITLYGMNPDEWGLNGMYGVEFDRTLTGQGDLIVWAENIQDKWTIKNVSAYLDNDKDVGGPQPLVADAGYKGTGYESRIKLEGTQVAFARISPDDPEAVQIAVSRDLLENPTEFLWGAWADNGLKDVTMFDYNDSMGPSAAGSPINTDADYPLKALYNLDNTCRLPFGFEQLGASYPGMCITMAAVSNAPNCVTTCTTGPAGGPAVCTTVCN